ncbi:MAG TPA: hypothetical protein VF245_01225 [Solirubrobacterales bacterium]
MLLASLLVVACFCGTASAKRLSLVGSDGKIHACYRVKGKPKGMVRVVRGGAYRCRRGERRMAWPVAVVAGAPGAPGAKGDPGAAGAPGAGSDDAVLKTQITELTARVGALEGVLAGITNEDLTGMLATLEGLSNEDLTNAVNAVPAVESLCENSEELNEQVNLVAEAVEGLGLNGTLKTLGGLLLIPPLPEALEPFSC